MYFTKSKKPKRTILLIVGIVLLLALVFAVLEVSGITHVFHKANNDQATYGTASQSTKGEPTDTDSSKQNPSPAPTSSPNPTSTDTGSQPTNDKSSTDGSAPVTLQAPTGNFVSAHKVPVNAPLASVCNTTSGVSCQITFTSNGVTKSLPAQTTDRGGSTYWNGWTPSKIGLTAGSWKIQAIATSGNQKQTTDDALTLEITQ